MEHPFTQNVLSVAIMRIEARVVVKTIIPDVSKVMCFMLHTVHVPDHKLCHPFEDLWNCAILQSRVKVFQTPLTSLEFQIGSPFQREAHEKSP